jgi:hypothetical protein
MVKAMLDERMRICRFLLRKRDLAEESRGESAGGRFSRSSPTQTNVVLRVQSTAHQNIHIRLSTALISGILALILNCKCIACRAVDRTWLVYTSAECPITRGLLGSEMALSPFQSKAEPAPSVGRRVDLR